MKKVWNIVLLLMFNFALSAVSLNSYNSLLYSKANSNISFNTAGLTFSENNYEATFQLGNLNLQNIKIPFQKLTLRLTDCNLAFIASHHKYTFSNNTSLEFSLGGFTVKDEKSYIAVFPCEITLTNCFLCGADLCLPHLISFHVYDLYAKGNIELLSNNFNAKGNVFLADIQKSFLFNNHSLNFNLGYFCGNLKINGSLPVSFVNTLTIKTSAATSAFYFIGEYSYKSKKNSFTFGSGYAYLPEINKDTVVDKTNAGYLYKLLLSGIQSKTTVEKNYGLIPLYISDTVELFKGTTLLSLSKMMVIPVIPESDTGEPSITSTSSSDNAGLSSDDIKSLLLSGLSIGVRINF